MTNRLVLLVTSPRVAPGLLSADAWAVLRSGPLLARVSVVGSLGPIVAAGVVVRSVPDDCGAGAIAREMLAAAAGSGTATWWVGADDEAPMADAVATLAAADDGRADVELVVLRGSWDLPGARLLDVVTTMDRLRSPGGCPWDAAQDHETLAPYLLEEAYEAYQAIEDRDATALRDELGDVLLQVAFHARLAEELPEAERWSVDDVATGLVAKLVRRHPHVFGGVEVAGADEVITNWETIKAAERGGAAAVASVPLSAPALTLAATLQRKADRGGAGPFAGLRTTSLSDALARYDGTPSTESAGELLWALVAAMRSADVDAESALRAVARTYRDHLVGDASA